jgi:hypothetical protein
MGGTHEELSVRFLRRNDSWPRQLDSLSRASTIVPSELIGRHG